MAAVQDATIVTELNDALTHLQAASDRFAALGMSTDRRLDAAVLDIQNMLGIGGKSFSEGQSIANEAHSA